MNKTLTQSRKSLFALAVLGISVLSTHAMAAIAGFGDGSNYTLNGYNLGVSGTDPAVNDPATISGGVLTITNTTNSQARSAFFNTPQAVGSFVASFTYQDINPTDGGPDGFAFVLQNQGLTAVAGGSAGLGLTTNGAPDGSSPIVPAVGLEFFLRNGTGATELSANGSGQFLSATSTSPVDLVDGDPIAITLTYDAALFQLTEVLTDLTTLDTITLVRSADFQDVLGPTAYVGFTGATGGVTGVQQISNFTFTFTGASVPEPASLGLLTAGTLALAARRRRN